MATKQEIIEEQNKRIEVLRNKTEKLRKRNNAQKKKIDSLKSEVESLEQDKKILQDETALLKKQVTKFKNVEFEISVSLSYEGRKHKKNTVMDSTIDLKGILPYEQYEELLTRVKGGELASNIFKEYMPNFAKSNQGVPTIMDKFKHIEIGETQEEITDKNSSRIQGRLDIKGGGAFNFEK